MTKSAETVKKMIRGTIRIAAWWGAGVIVAYGVNAIVPPSKRKGLNGVCILTASMVIGDIVTEAVIKHTDKSIDQFWDDINPKKWQKIFNGTEENTPLNEE